MVTPGFKKYNDGADKNADKQCDDGYFIHNEFPFFVVREVFETPPYRYNRILFRDDHTALSNPP